MYSETDNKERISYSNYSLDFFNSWLYNDVIGIEL